MKKIIFINTHPIQYFAPMYTAINREGKFDLEVWYCTNHGVDGSIDKQFGTAVKWDIPLLDGYKYRFLKNNSWKPGIYGGFWGICNWEIVSLLRRSPKSIVIIYGWNNASYILALVFAKLFGHETGIRCEAPITLEERKPKSMLFLRKWVFSILFRLIDHFLFIGHNNQKFYERYGVKKDNLLFTPYSVDNERFITSARSLLPKKSEIRLTKKLKDEVCYVLYSGKFIAKKRPLDLLKAVKILQDEGYKIGVIFMGDGDLKRSMEALVDSHRINDILITGFINQQEIPFYYTCADCFVMCSDENETWGLSTNEAMNFGLPIIISDRVGCAPDLVIDNLTGYSFEFGNINDLALKIKNVYNSKDKFNSEIIKDVVNNYSYQRVINNLTKHIDVHCK